MKLVKKLTGILEWIVAVVLLAICIYCYLFSYGSFTAENAFKASEKTSNYGPSEVKKVIDFENEKIYLAKYKDWFSANAVRKASIKWYPQGTGGTPIDYNNKITHSYDGSSNGQNSFICKIYGYVNDPDITEIDLEVSENGQNSTLKYNIDSNKMFIFYWDDKIHHYSYTALTGLNKDGQKVYEYKY
ncbi:MAG: hypothetical protein Q8930_07215 [Bacillota bacterium]|nr:hypothetical protein [Bacillota bacterium]